MKYLRNTIRHVLAAVTVAVSTVAAHAQHKLPETHQTQHLNLLANQGSMTTPFKFENNKKLQQELLEREQMLDSDIYGQFWNRDAVNPYGASVAIPAHKDIDVSEFSIPVPGAVTSAYGYRPRFGRMHKGVDLRLAIGDTVRAAFSGKIRMTKYEARGYGYYVVMRHDNGMETVYGHLKGFLVKPDQYVKAGDPIALGGNTGRSTGPHLHFETRYLGIPINPAAIIDFDNKVTHKDVFAFDKNTYGKSQNYAPARAKRKTTASRKRTPAKKSTTTRTPAKKTTAKKSTAKK